MQKLRKLLRLPYFSSTHINPNNQRRNTTRNLIVAGFLLLMCCEVILCDA